MSMRTEIDGKPVLVTWGTKMGGTEGIARMIGEVLVARGFAVTLVPASRAGDASRYGAAVIGGGLYANRWHRDAYRFASRQVSALRKMPVWLFSSGPLDDSADREPIPPTTQVAVLMERIGAVDHVTFGGRLPADAKGFPAASMARAHSGDWRNPERIRAWAAQLAAALPTARPREAVYPPAGRLRRLIAYGVAGWALCALVMSGLLAVSSSGVAMAVHAVAAPVIFTLLATRYFRARGARDPLPTATVWTALVIGLDGLTALALRNQEMFTSIVGTWLPFLLIFLAISFTGFLMTTMPWHRPVTENR
jgi:menaquinone-dependent protoporphyrinogen oxidase